ncbi:MAG: hypothetical protein LCH95_14000 [Proteobacteria bacterium]|nr:hypothetical protein [Pseudomonadota bacterium]
MRRLRGSSAKAFAYTVDVKVDRLRNPRGRALPIKAAVRVGGNQREMQSIAIEDVVALIHLSVPGQCLSLTPKMAERLGVVLVNWGRRRSSARKDRQS